MGVGGTEADPAQIRDAGHGIELSAQELAAAIQALQAELAGHGAPWGDDDIGSLIGGVYQAIVEIAMECLGMNAEDIAGFAEGVQAMAATYEKTEATNVEQLGRVRDAPDNWR